ncbi:putative methyltransferase B0303.2 [Aphelenchoides fujianensis]|nr:putative methyltransferase B0303.2 [Aphelenchoides fujianensis]
MATSDEPKSAESSGIEATEEEMKKWPLFSARDHDQKFSPLEYLQDFYSTHKDDVAMQIILFFLPGILYRLPASVGDVLDLGAGPTVYIPIAMRHRARRFFSSDYAEANRNIVTSWIKKENPPRKKAPQEMEQLAREKMCAVLNVDVHKQPVVQSVHFKVDDSVEIPAQFDVVSTVFCLEYASETLEEFRRAVRNASSLIKPGGFLVEGGVFEADEYSFSGRRFKSCFIRKEDVLSALKECGHETTEGEGFHLINTDDIFLLVSKKL